MRIISCHRDLLDALAERERAERQPRARQETEGFGDGIGGAGKSFLTGLDELDYLPPRGAFALGAVHEVLSEPQHGLPRFFALLLARSAALGPGRDGRCTGGAVVWSDPRHEAYPPALAAGGLPLERLVLLRPRNAADEVWALAECLRCRGVAAVVAAPPPLSRVQARRLQLAAERGGGAGIFLRAWSGGGKGGGSYSPCALHYAAATRWLVGPVPGDRDVQRWRVQLIHGHGGRVGRSVVLEVLRGTPDSGTISTIGAIGTADPVRFAPLAGPVPPIRAQADPVRAVEMLAHRPPAAEKPKVSA